MDLSQASKDGLRPSVWPPPSAFEYFYWSVFVRCLSMTNIHGLSSESVHELDGPPWKFISYVVQIRPRGGQGHLQTI